MLNNYTDIQKISENHDIYLVRSLQDNIFYVKKILNIYDVNVYNWLSKNNIVGIPKVKEYEEINGKLIVIEEYIAGNTLEDILKDKGHLSEKEVRQIALSICQILKQIEDSIPLVHRDIKPANIIIKDNSQLYLIDFNAAKIIYEEKSRDTILLGTRGYAAPEQYGFASSNIQTDIYAIGVLMKELLTGSIDLNTEYESDLKPIIQKCTMMDPKTRYQDYETLIKHLSKKQHTINEYLPIGFRSGKITHMLLAAFWYFIIIFAASGMTVEGEYGTKLLIDRIGFALAFISITFFSGNYLNCQEVLGLKDIKNKFLRFIVIVFINILLFIVILFIALA